MSEDKTPEEEEAPLTVEEHSELAQVDPKDYEGMSAREIRAIKLQRRRVNVK